MDVSEKVKKECCGCGACKNICPVEAIEFVRDSEGFLYPDVNHDLCIGCGKCMDVCSFKKYNSHNSMLCTYAARDKNVNNLIKSQSGGASYIFSKAALNHDFVIWGMGYDNQKKIAKNVYITKEDELDLIRGSKYIQGDIIESYIEISRQLQAGSKVIFTGTPCQISALLSYLNLKKISLEKLYTIDIVCHGTPSPRMWRDYVSCQVQKYRLEEENLVVKFRDKERLGWHSHEESFESVGRKKIYSHKFANLFYTHYALRPSCYNCYFANIYRNSDITIADCWGIEKVYPEKDDNKGWSLVCINSLKGNYLMDMAKTLFEFYEIDIRDFMQPNLEKPSYEPKDRHIFWENYDKKGFKYILKKYDKESFKSKAKRLIQLFNNRALWK